HANPVLTGFASTNPETLSRTLPLCHNRIADRGRGRRFRRAERLHFLPLLLLLRGAVAQADLASFRFETQHFEIVFIALREHGCDSCAASASGLFLIAIALRTTLLDFRNVAEPFDAVRQFDESAEVRDAGNLALNHVVDFVR